MNEWLLQQIRNGLANFPGLTVTGTIPIKEDLINEVLAKLIAAPVTAPGGLDLTTLLRVVKRVSVHTQPGIVSIDFSVQV